MKVLLIWDCSDEPLRFFEVTGDPTTPALAAHGAYINGKNSRAAEAIGRWFWDDEGDAVPLPDGVSEITLSLLTAGPFTFDRIVSCGFLS